MDPVLEQICAEKGVFLRKEAVQLGYNDAVIARLVKDGTLIRVRRGAYTFDHVWRTLTPEGKYALRTRSVLRQAKTPVVLSHVSALPEWGAPLWDLDLTTVHVTRLDGRTGRRERGVQQHQGCIVAGDVTARNGVSVMSATRTALEVTTVAGLEASLCVLDDLLHRGLTTIELLYERYETMNYWPNTLSTDLALRLSDGRAESIAETRTRFLCWRGSLPAPVPQYEIRDEYGDLVAKVDLAWPELGVFLEFDGRVKYERFLRKGETAADAVIREKRREERICELTGWRCIRITWADLERPEATIARIRNLLFPGSRAS